MESYRAFLLQAARLAEDAQHQRFDIFDRHAAQEEHLRGKFLQRTAYYWIAQGLLQLAAAVEEEPPRMTRYASNDVIGWLVDKAAQIAHRLVMSRADCAHRWAENVALWLARDAQPKQGKSQYALILRSSSRALDRTNPDERY